MTIIHIEGDYVRSLGDRHREFAQATLELKQFIQYRMLGDAKVRAFLGPAVPELELMVRRLNQEGMLLDGDMQSLYGLADRVVAINGGIGHPSFLQPGYLTAGAGLLGGAGMIGLGMTMPASPFLTSFYQRPATVVQLGSYVYRRRYVNLV